MTERPVETDAGVDRLRVGAVVAAVFLAALPVALFVLDHRGALYDDAFIYFRYVDNIAAGCGLRFNCGGAPVEGFTSALYLALLAALAAVGMALPDAATVVGAVSVFAAALGAAALSARVVAGARGDAGLGAASRPVVGAAAGLGTLLVLGGDDFWLLNAVIGLETALAAALCTAVAWRLARARQVPCAAQGTVWSVWLAWLARPEAAVFGLAALWRPAPDGSDAAQTRRARARIFVGLGLLVAIVVTARLVIFEDIVPNTARAKAGGTRAHFLLGVEYLLEFAKDFPLAALAPLGLVLAPIRRAAGPWCIGAIVWAASMLVTGGDHFAYGRMLAPLVPAATGIAVASAALALVWVFGRAAAAPATARRAAIVLLLLASAAAAVTLPRHALPELHAFPNVERWIAVGSWLRANHPNATIATVPIGAIGWTSRLPLVDLVGLTEPAIARDGRTLPPERLNRAWLGHEKEHTAWVLKRAPDILVFTRSSPRPFSSLAETRAGFWAEWLLLRAIKEGRAPYTVLPAEVAPGLHWLMFRRVGPPPRDDAALQRDAAP